MTFEEYAKDLMIDPDARDWILAKNAFDAGYTQCQFDVNTRLGDSSNEAEKDARRKVAVAALKEMNFGIWEGPQLAEVDAIIREAQG